jgi:glutathione peroxidase
MSPFHDFEMTSITGDPVSFDRFRGQVCLVVNVASAWGLTPQYAGLRALHDAHDDVTVLGFPCNQFGGQEPGTDAEILEFATSRYGVTFPMFSKIEVNGPGASPLYRFLRSEQRGEGDSSDITWNFEKFLVDKEGVVVARFPPPTTPEEVGEIVPRYQ